MSHQRSRLAIASLPDEAVATARQALAEARLRGLPAAEEYRIIADRLYRGGFRDLPPGALVEWIELAVAEDYEQLLELRALGDRLHDALAAGEPGRAAWLLICDLDLETRQRLADGIQRLNALERAAG